VTEQRTPSIAGVWILATRPKTLPAALAPVMVGTALAMADSTFALFPALAALAVALLLQIGVNLANDYFDYMKGVDTEERLGPMRVTQSGLMSPATVRQGMFLAFGMAILVGGYLVYVAGWPLLVAGLAAIASALAYSGGRFPLASAGLGDLFVFLFFGIVAVNGTYYVQALSLNGLVLGASVPVGLLITAIIVVNNLRDMDTDRAAGKLTLAVRLGRTWTRREYTALIAGAYLFPPFYVFAYGGSWWSLLPLLSLPAAWHLIKMIYRTTGAELNTLLARTALLSLVFCFLFATGLIL
jgi:1,4-dihydroxy-2-naphthoate octaprenyltransferase